ncbi:hypothetical protein DZF91_15950 [Actinomadura logoneensis]|uniref:DUF4352 domain-containing protein n=1 Tax=Actinomadura logoneensis TaxID=2293572 RepID=A0A372JL45_9ACTN|nr:hypothetical protein [Actinomadura logoneensis]RFU40649.1 hypothetical protein DZF91_15950 [Actinomadura logoneensis]
MTVPRALRAAPVAVLAVALALTGCSSEKKKDAKPGAPPPPPTEQPETQTNAAPGAKAVAVSGGLKKPVTYSDKVTVAVSGVRYVKNTKKGPGEVTGRTLTIFTLKFSNGSGQPLDLNGVRVVAKYGPAKRTASPTSYANLNDFYGVVSPGGSKTASYAFDLPSQGYKSVMLGVSFDGKHKTALFTGAIHP